jgi:probable rRNA maturation factor
MLEVTLDISIRSRQRARGRMRLIRAAVDAALAQATIRRPVTLLVRLTDDAELQQLNLQFRGINAPTDVLSFASEQWLDGKLKRRQAPDSFELGEIYISMDHCAAQALEHGHGIDDELTLLVIHGTLHLLGYDHMQARRKRSMWSAQDRAFALLGMTNPLGRAP